jgi:large subunit ribosomal protein L9e
VLKGRHVTVKGPRGTLERDLSHQDLEVTKLDDHTIKVVKWFGLRKEIASIRSVCSAVENMITGVTKGFQYKMRLVYAHFPINAVLTNSTDVEIRNFLGQKKVFRVKMRKDTKITKSTDVKDQLVLVGNDLDAVAQSAADVQQACKVRNKDIRKFLDGIYVSERSGSAV